MLKKNKTKQKIPISLVSEALSSVSQVVVISDIPVNPLDRLSGCELLLQLLYQLTLWHQMSEVLP